MSGCRCGVTSDAAWDCSSRLSLWDTVECWHICRCAEAHAPLCVYTACLEMERVLCKHHCSGLGRIILANKAHSLVVNLVSLKRLQCKQIFTTFAIPLYPSSKMCSSLADSSFIAKGLPCCLLALKRVMREIPPQGLSSPACASRNLHLKGVLANRSAPCRSHSCFNSGKS